MPKLALVLGESVAVALGVSALVPTPVPVECIRAARLLVLVPRSAVPMESAARVLSESGSWIPAPMSAQRTRTVRVPGRRLLSLMLKSSLFRGLAAPALVPGVSDARMPPSVLKG